MRCRDRAWCRLEACGVEGYKPRGAVYRATFKGLRYLTAKQIFKIETFDRDRVDARGDELLEKFGDAIMDGLHAAGVVPQDQDDYLEDQLDEALEDVRVAIESAARATPDMLGIITRVMNEV